MATSVLSGVKVHTWQDFSERLRWNQDQHFTVIGPTGSGKSTIAGDLLQRRRRILFLATKPHDVTLEKLRTGLGMTVARAWPPRHVAERVMLWPRSKGLIRDVQAQRVHFARAIDSTYMAGKCCIVLDEGEYVTQALGLDRMLRVLWAQGRSNKVGVLAMTQRPRFLPRIAWSSADHLLIARSLDREDVAALGGMGGTDAGLIREAVTMIPRHWWLYVNTRNDEIAIIRPMEVKT